MPTSAATTKAFRKGFQQNYKQSMNAFTDFIEKEFSDQIIETFHLIHYANWLYIPTRFLLVLGKKNYYSWHYQGVFNPGQHASQIRVSKNKELAISLVSANLLDRLNFFSIGSYFKVENPNPLLTTKGKFVVENTESFNFQDKDKQENLIKLLQ